jgi:hypothetical protein
MAPWLVTTSIGLQRHNTVATQRQESITEGTNSDAASGAMWLSTFGASPVLVRLCLGDTVGEGEWRHNCGLCCCVLARTHEINVAFWVIA